MKLVVATPIIVLGDPPVNAHKNARTKPYVRELMAARRAEGWSAAEIAEAAGVSTRTVHKWLARKSAQNVDLFGNDLHPAGLDLGQVENVADQAEQVRRGGGDLANIGDGLLHVSPVHVLDRHFGVTDDGVERGAKLMAHAGDKPRFRQRGLFQTAHRLQALGQSPGVLRGGLAGLHRQQQIDRPVRRREVENARLGVETINEEQPHSAIGNKCPIELMIGSGANGPP